MPPGADRSLKGVLSHLVSRLILLEPNPWANPVGDDDSSDGEYAGDDEFFGLGFTASIQSNAIKTALGKDFQQILDAGYRPGFTHVSDLDNIVSVAVRVNDLGVPLRALQAWDSNLLTGEVVYLVLLINIGPQYPNMDRLTRGQLKFRVGLSDRYKPSKAAAAAAFRSHTAAYTRKSSLHTTN